MISGGRKPGQEDLNSHFRKGIAGDWRDQFTPRIKAIFRSAPSMKPGTPAFQERRVACRRCIHLIAELSLTPKTFAAERADTPPST